MGTIASDVTVPEGEFAKAYEDFAKLGDVPSISADVATADDVAAHVKKIVAANVLGEISSDPAKYDTGKPDVIAVTLMSLYQPLVMPDVFEVASTVGPGVSVMLLGGGAADLDGTEGKQACFDNGSVFTIRTANKSDVTLAYGGITETLDAPVAVGLTFTVHEPFALPSPYSTAIQGVPYAPNGITEADVTEVLKG